MGSLVSIIIVSYNSSEFVIETLESILCQTWSDLELIITDDCSSDETVELCQNWVKKNNQRFQRVEIIAAKENTGIPANANRGAKAATGDWIKFVAADDTLLPKCIEDNVNWVMSNPDIKVLFSYVNVYKNEFKPQHLINTIPHDPNNQNGILAPERTVESQYKMLLISDRIHFSPSFFLHREALLSIGGFDEKFRLLEDYPLWLNLTKAGYKLNFMNKLTVNYRTHPKAINNTGNDFLVNPNYFKLEKFRKKYTYPFLPIDIYLNQRFRWFASQIFRHKWINRKNRLNIFLLSMISSYFNPFNTFIWIKKHANKNLSHNEFYM